MEICSGEIDFCEDRVTSLAFNEIEISLDEDGLFGQFQQRCETEDINAMCIHDEAILFCNDNAPNKFLSKRCSTGAPCGCQPLEFIVENEEICNDGFNSFNCIQFN